jgi:hypothetical protein
VREEGRRKEGRKEEVEEKGWSECREIGTKRGRKEGRKEERKSCYDYISITIFKIAFINEIKGLSKCK